MFACVVPFLRPSCKPSKLFLSIHKKSALNEAHPSPVHRRVPGRSAHCCGKSNESQTPPARHLQRNRAARNGFKAGPTENMTPAFCFSTGDSHQPPSRSQHVFPLHFCRSLDKIEARRSDSHSCASVRPQFGQKGIEWKKKKQHKEGFTLSCSFPYICILAELQRSL